MEPLRITAVLVRPVLSLSHPIMLDGVLAAAKVKRAEIAGHPDPWSVQDDLPLARYESPSGQWVWQASAFVPQPLSEHLPLLQTSRHDLARMTQDIDDGLVQIRKAKINPAGGMFRTSYEYLRAQWWQQAHADCIGDRDAIADLLQEITHLGGRRSLGLGEVSEWRVDVIDAGSCRWMRRPMPADSDAAASDISYAPAMQTLRPPYWRKTARQTALVPVA